MRNSPLVVDDLGAALVAELARAPPCSSSTTSCISSSSLREDGAQPLDGLEQLGQLVEDLLPLEAGQPLQLHVEDRLRLHLRSRTAPSALRAPRPGSSTPRISLITSSR